MGSKLRKKLMLFYHNKKARMGPRSVVTLGVSLFLISIVFPLAMVQILAANTTAWDAAVVTIFTVVLPILAIIGVALDYIPKR